MDTPQAPVAPQTRRGKKHRIDFDSPHEKDQNDFDRAVDLIVRDQTLPPHLKTAIGFMLEMKEQMNAVMTRNQELVEENRKVNEKNSIKESSAPLSTARVIQDINCVRHLLDFLEEHDIISSNQHGFQKGKSTVTAMVKVLNDWTKYLDEGKSVDVVYFDFCKAFDKVSHSKLIHKMQLVGIHPRIVSWIKAFLTDRTYSVRVNSVLSFPRPACSGVPQGGVLSPILFNIYTFDLLSALSDRGIQFSAFADDVKLYRPIVTENDRSALQEAVDFVHSWSCGWGLPLSMDKCKVLHLGSRNKCDSYTIDNTRLEEPCQVTDLGFIITKDLSFDTHCQMIALKASKAIYNLFRAFSTTNSYLYLQAYKLYIRPILEYGTPVFSPHKQSIINKLESVQNSFTRKLMMRALGLAYDQIPCSWVRNENLGLPTLLQHCFVEDVGTMNNCTRVIGDVKFDELSSETWQRVITVEGTLHIENTDIESLDAMKDLQIVGLMTPALVISKNKKLVDIAALMSMNITSEEPVLEFKDNPVVCHNIVERRALDKWTTEKGIYVKFAENCLKSCPGGVVTSEYLANLDKRCNFIKGNLIIDKIKDLPTNMNKLEQVEKIYGRLFITNNEAVEDLRFLRNLKDIINSGHERPALVIENNKNLINTTLESLKRVREGEWKETTRWHLEDILTWDPDSYGGEGEVSIEGIYGRPTGTKAEDDYPLLLGLAAFIVFLVAIAAAIGILTTIKLRKKACGPSSRRKKERTPKAMGKKRTFFKQRGRLNKGTPTEKSKTPTPAKQSGRPTKGTPTGKSKTPTPAQQSGRLNKGTPTAEQSKTPTPAKQSGRLNKGTPAGKSKAPTPAQQSGRQNKGTPTAASRTPTPLKESKRPQKAAPHLKNKKPVAAGQHR
ncbi:hypothetical protein Y032_0212g2233 [Ancylostoma ceylanicum]|uniref:Reverse transcriptase domain-containing protein n=2 Tax=Ancylostoma ceylanicum TaxID=53326 RepID=A0A016SKP8_9BILA|nr:hypothetical protein Y032_0212g2233 [Ancylostoma ceylanicum]